MSCPSCECILIHHETCREEVRIGKHRTVVVEDYHYSRCAGCGAEYVDYDQSKHNDAAFFAAYQSLV